MIIAVSEGLSSWCVSLMTSLHKRERKRLLALQPETFDQSRIGWRMHDGVASNLELASLLDEYADNKYCYPPIDSYPWIIIWHAGHFYTKLGDYNTAVIRYEKALMPTYKLEFNYWNHYVKAKIAFLKDDRNEFDSRRAAIAAWPAQCDGTNPHLDIVDDWAMHWGEPMYSWESEPQQVPLSRRLTYQPG